MADNILFKTAPLGELKDYDDQKMIIQGYGSYFGSSRIQQFPNTQYTSIPYRPNNQGWYTTSASGGRRPAINTGNIYLNMYYILSTKVVLKEIYAV